MFKKVVLSVGVIAIGLSLSSNAEAGRKKEVESGPMDKFVSRKNPQIKIYEKSKKIEKRRRAPRKLTRDQVETMRYVLAREGFTQDCSKFELAYLSKI